MIVTQNDLGYEFETSEVLILWGGINANIDHIKLRYPQYQFTRIKQVHSDIVVHSPSVETDYTQIADAHWTQKTNLGLCVSTADCVPIMIYSPRTKTIAAIHAGWRGVANKIFPLTIQKLKNQGAEVEHLHVFIGPHILKQSFEVDHQVANQILATVKMNTSSKLGSEYFELDDRQKAFVDLSKVLMEQARLEGIPETHLKTFLRDTKTNLEFHSHRRDKEQSGRQLSFILKKEPFNPE